MKYNFVTDNHGTTVL